MSKIGTADIKGIMLGSTEISKAYLGSDVVYQKENKYIQLDAVLFGASVYVTLPIAPNDAKWEFEGAVARHSGTVDSNTALYRFICAQAFNVNNQFFGFSMYPNTSFNIRMWTKHNSPMQFTVPSTADAKITFSAKVGEATVNGVTQTLARTAGTTASNRTLIIGDFSRKKMSIVYWYFKAWHNNVLVGNYVPAQRIEDNVIGIWDKATDTFLVPSGGSLTEYTSS